MILPVLVCLAVAALAIVAGPAIIGRGSWGIRRPALAIGVWLAVVTTGGAALFASLGLALVAALTTGSSHSIWLAPVALTVFAWVGLAAAGGIASLAVSRSQGLAIAHRHTDVAVTLLCATSAYRWDDLRGTEICFVESDAATAMATRAGGTRIIVSRRVEEALGAGELRAVLEHERAHLAHGHDRLLALARLNHRCFPGLPGARGFEQTVRMLIELLADDTAARRCGSAVTARALTRLADLAPAGLSSSGVLRLRARRLAGRSARASRSGRAVPRRRTA